MDPSIRSISFTWLWTLRCFRVSYTWTCLSIVILSAGVVNSLTTQKPLDVTVSATPDKAKPGSTIYFTCNHNLNPGEIVLLYWVDGYSKTLYSMYYRKESNGPEIGPEYTDKVFDIIMEDRKHTFKMNATACDASRYKCSVWDTLSREGAAFVDVAVVDFKPPTILINDKIASSNPAEVSTSDSGDNDNGPRYPKGIPYQCVVSKATLRHELNLTIHRNDSLIYNSQSSSVANTRKCLHSSVITTNVHQMTPGDEITAMCTVRYDNGVFYTTDVPVPTTTVATTTVTVPSTTKTSSATPGPDTRQSGNETNTAALMGVWNEPWFIGVCVLAATVLICIITLIIVLLLKKNKGNCFKNQLGVTSRHDQANDEFDYKKTNLNVNGYENQTSPPPLPTEEEGAVYQNEMQSEQNNE